MKVFHESVVVNLIETIMFHRTAIDAADDFLLELVDYSYRNIQKLVSGKIKYKDQPKTADEAQKVSKEQEFDRQLSVIEFNVAISSISIIRYISDQVKHLSPAVIRHLHLENDMLMACVALIEDRPWLKKEGGKPKEKFEDGHWVEIAKNELTKLPKVEGQIWITIYNLLLAPECAKNYEITDYRKNMLLRVPIYLPKLRKYLNELIIDQIPNLTDVLKTLEQLSIMNTNAQTARNPFVVQQLPELRRGIAEGKVWEEIAEHQLNNYFTRESEAAEFDDLVKFADMYSGSNIDALSEGFKCANCFKSATQRCSRCKIVWYCCRECQVEHYKKEHKHACKAMAAKIADNSDKTHVKGSSMIMKPSEVKAKTNQMNLVPQSKNIETAPKSKINVEVLNSTDTDVSKPTQITETSKEQPKLPENPSNPTKKLKNTQNTASQPDDNPMDELD